MNSNTTIEGANLLTIPQAADRLQMVPQSVWRLTWSGSLPSVKIRRARRIRPEDLTRFIEENLVTPKTASHQ